MSMDASAIAQIQETTQAAAAHVTLQEFGGIPAVIIPKTHEVKDVEHLQLHRSRFRASLKTNCMADFHSYYQVNAIEQCCAVFIQQESMTAKAIFNLYTAQDNEPDHGDHTAQLAQVPTAAFKALRQIDGERLSQKQLAEWMEDWRTNLTAADNNEKEINIAGAISAVRKITIEAIAKRDSEVKNFGASQSALESIEAKSEHPLPDYLTFTCEPYKDLSTRAFHMRVSVITGEREPKLTVRIIKFEDHQEAMAEEFKQLITRGLPDSAGVYLGEFKLNP